MDVSQKKQALRQTIKERLAALSPEDLLGQSIELCDRIPLLLAQATGVGGYIALPDEADIGIFLHVLPEKGIPLYLPRYENGTVTFHAVRSLEELEKGDYGLLQPRSDAPQPEPGSLSHLLVPGRAFDPLGRRLGRGKGGYDRWIAEAKGANPSLLCIGIALREQIVPSVPEEPHDRRMDAVLTPDGLLMEDPFLQD